MKNKTFIDIQPAEWVIRTAEIDDAYNIADVHIKSLKWAYGKKVSNEALSKLNIEEKLNIWNSRILNNELDIFVVYENDVLLAFIDVDTKSYNYKIGEMHRLYSRPEAMRKRPGYFLFKYILKLYESKGIEYLFGWVLDNNLLARRFYEKMGVIMDPDITKKMLISGCECNALKYVYHFKNKS